MASTIWRKKRFLTLWGAQAISLVGDQIYLLALPLLVYDITKSGTQMSFVFAFEMLPYVVFSLIGGVLSDKWNRKHAMVWGNLLAILPLASIVLLYNLDLLAMWHIYVAAFLLSSVVSIVLPAFEASIPNILNQEELLAGNSLIETTVSGSQILGPIVAGAVIGLFGADIAILINAISFLCSALLFLTIRMEQRQTLAEGSKIKAILASLWEGLR
ncbi:MAG: MFS transporter, partial [Tumebacillaceae bacterium]